MNLFLDSSALAKVYVEELGSDRVRERLEGASALGVSVLVVPEVIAALTRRRREAFLAEDQYRSAKEALLLDLSEASIIHFTDGIIETAIGILEEYPLRSSDALHITCAAEWGCDLFLSADDRQCEAASACGLRVEQIGSGGPDFPAFQVHEGASRFTPEEVRGALDD